MDTNDFPRTDSILVNALFEQKIRKRIVDLNQQKRIVDSHRPPTQADIDRFILTTDDPAITEPLDAVKFYEEKLANLKQHLQDYAMAALHSPANDDERQAARSRFNALKKQLIESLHSLGVVAADEEEPAVVEWVTNFQKNLPAINTKAATNDLKSMRKWLQEHHPEAGIKSRGTIPLEWQEKYYAANP